MTDTQTPAAEAEAPVSWQARLTGGVPLTTWLRERGVCTAA